MSGVNKVILVGNLGNDPETKFSQAGTAVTKCSLATTSVRKGKDGERIEETQWHRVTFFNKLAEVAGQYLKKGSSVYVEGSIRYDKYTGKDGVERYTTDIIADSMQMLGGRPEGERSSSPRTSAPSRDANRSSSAPMAKREVPTPGKASDFGADFADDDIPF